MKRPEKNNPLEGTGLPLQEYSKAQDKFIDQVLEEKEGLIPYTKHLIGCNIRRNPDVIVKCDCGLDKRLKK